jgi:hypothetical protein
MKMFKYNCTNEILDVEKELNESIENVEHIKEEEIELLKSIDGREDFYELLCSEPEYYLKLLESCDDLKQLREDFDIEFIRDDVKSGYRNNLRIKFKIRASDFFTEVGFFSEAKDNETYNEFKIKVLSLLKRGQNGGIEIKDDSHLRSHLDSELNDNVETQSIFDKNFSEKIEIQEDTKRYEDTIGVKERKEYSENENDEIKQLEYLRDDCPKEYLNDYDKMLLNLKFNKKSLHIPSKNMFEKLLKIYNASKDDVVKFEIDCFLYNNIGYLVCDL